MEVQFKGSGQSKSWLRMRWFISSPAVGQSQRQMGLPSGYQAEECWVMMPKSTLAEYWVWVEPGSDCRMRKDVHGLRLTDRHTIPSAVWKSIFADCKAAGGPANLFSVNFILPRPRLSVTMFKWVWSLSLSGSESNDMSQQSLAAPSLCHKAESAFHFSSWIQVFCLTF